MFCLFTNLVVIGRNANTSLFLVKIKGKEQRKIDFGYLACQHHVYMSVGVQLATAIQRSQQELKNVLVIGLGGGGLCMFLHEAIP